MHQLVLLRDKGLLIMFFYTQDQDGNITSYGQLASESEKEDLASVGFKFTEEEIISLSDGKMIFKSQASSEELQQQNTLALDDTRYQVSLSLSSQYEITLHHTVLNYSTSESLTFDQQLSEARNYRITGDREAAPMLVAISNARGITLEELVTKVLQKHKDYSVIMGSLMGQRKVYEEAIENATSVEELNSLTFNFEVPTNDNS